MVIKKFFKKIIPHGIIVYRERKNRHNFIDLLKEHRINNIFVNKQNLENNYKCIVSVQGFGYSGSGAVLDFLREFEDVSVWGYVDKESSRVSLKQSVGEIDFIRLSGGLFDIEKYIGAKNIFLADAVLNRFILLVENSYIYKKDRRIRNLFMDFFSDLVELSINDLDHAYYNGHLANFDEKTSIFFLKDIDICSYRSKCEIFLKMLFNELNIYKHSFLVIDQLMTDFEFDTKKEKKYIRELKTIVVVRDPRDIYVFARTRHVEWIPTDKVQDFEVVR